MVKNPPASAGGCKRYIPWIGKIPWRRNWQPTPICVHVCVCVCVCVYFNQIWEVLAIIVSNIFAAISVFSGASLVAQRLKRLPARQETQIQSLGREDPLEKELATHSSILAWRIPRTEEPGGLQSTGSQRVGHD